MIRTAVLLTVYNRREVTLNGLRTLYKAIETLGDGYIFDVYMTDDGSTDGTGEAVSKEFPNVKITKGDGTLFWGGGMRKAWQSAIDSNIKYDYYMWYNDDSLLYENALQLIMNTNDKSDIYVGAFCDNRGVPSYGGKKRGKRVTPNGEWQEIELMNGNLVLIPRCVYESVGMIDKNFIHGEGDFDYGLRARRNGYKVLLSKCFIGIAERHDEIIPKYCSRDKTFVERWKTLHNPMNSPFSHFKYNFKYNGKISAFISFVICYIGVFFPRYYTILKYRKIRHT